MNAAAQQRPPAQANPNVSQPQVVQTKVSYGPLILTTFLTTVVTLGVGMAFASYQKKREKDEEEKKQREREERAQIMPPMPMLWPGGAPSSAANPASAHAAMQEKEQDLKRMVQKLEKWDRDLAEREAALGTGSLGQNLHLVREEA